MSLPFENVREQLLRAGVAPRHARRYVTELREHLSDLTDQERQAGADSKDAVSRARAKLGSDTELVKAMTEKPGFRSVAARAPWAAYGLAPLTLFIVMVMGLTMLLFNLMMPYLGPGGNASIMPDSVKTLSAAIMFAGNYLAGPLAAALCIGIALRQRTSSTWPWIGLILIAAFTGVMGLRGGDGRPYGMIQMSVVDITLRAGLLLLVAGLAYRTLRQRVVSDA